MRDEEEVDGWMVEEVEKKVSFSLETLLMLSLPSEQLGMMNEEEVEGWQEGELEGRVKARKTSAKDNSGELVKPDTLIIKVRILLILHILGVINWSMFRS